MKPTIRIHNTETNEVIDREMTDDEFSAYKLQQVKDVEFLKIIEQDANKKAAVLLKLGITADEAKLLLS
jgi:hypothetical protein